MSSPAPFESENNCFLMRTSPATLSFVGIAPRSYRERIYTPNTTGRLCSLAGSTQCPEQRRVNSSERQGRKNLLTRTGEKPAEVDEVDQRFPTASAHTPRAGQGGDGGRGGRRPVASRQQTPLHPAGSLHTGTPTQGALERALSQHEDTRGPGVRGQRTRRHR